MAMHTYQMQEAEIAVSDAWRDLSVNSFLLKSPTDEGAASLVITRDLQSQETTIEGYSDQLLVSAAQQLSGYQLIGRGKATVDGRPAVQCDYTWSIPSHDVVHQRQLVVGLGPGFLAFTLTAKRPEFPAFESVWASFVRSIKFRKVPSRSGP